MSRDVGLVLAALVQVCVAVTDSLPDMVGVHVEVGVPVPVADRVLVGDVVHEVLAVNEGVIVDPRLAVRVHVDVGVRDHVPLLVPVRLLVSEGEAVRDGVCVLVKNEEKAAVAGRVDEAVPELVDVHVGLWLLQH